MKYLITVVLMSCLRTLVLAQNSKETKFKQVESLQNKISDQSLIVRYDRVWSKISCAKECSSNNQCTSFFYNKNQRFCSLHSEDNIRLDQTNDMEGAMFFKLRNPADSLKKNSSNGYSFSKTAGIWYKGYSEKMNWTSAVKKCESDGAILISPITKQERELVEYIRLNIFVLQFLPWIGCKAKESNEWVWMDGTALQQNNWRDYPGRNGHCCLLYEMKWFPVPCNQTWPFVCEIYP